MRILSGSTGSHCAVTLCVFCLSPQRVQGEDALRRRFSGSLGAQPRRKAWGGTPLSDSQFKGTSSPSSSPSPCGGSLKETVTVFGFLFFFPQRLWTNVLYHFSCFCTRQLFFSEHSLEVMRFFQNSGWKPWYPVTFPWILTSFLFHFLKNILWSHWVPSFKLCLTNTIKKHDTANVRVLSRIKLRQQWWAGACDL